MSTLAIVGIAIGIFLIANAIAGVICYYKLAVPAMKPLAEGDREVCRQIVQAGRGYPWVCRRALKTGQCPCQPCAKLQAQKSEPSGSH